VTKGRAWKKNGGGEGRSEDCLQSDEGHFRKTKGMEEKRRRGKQCGGT